MANGFRYGPPGEGAVHLCVDMQRLFGPGSSWAMPWMERRRPNVARLAEAHPARTVFTRFIPPARLEEARGNWLAYYQKWPQMLRDNLDPDWLRLTPELERLVPPARVFDKPVYSPWGSGELHRNLQEGRIDSLIISGGETDVCVLATVMGAVDLGYRVIIVSDATCSSADEGHDAALSIYATRFGQQIESVTTEQVLGCWF